MKTKQSPTKQVTHFQDFKEGLEDIRNLTASANAVLTHEWSDKRYIPSVLYDGSLSIKEVRLTASRGRL